MSAQANPSPQELLAQLDDIRGLAPVSGWPPGPGWWIVLGLAVLGLTAGGFIFQRRRARARSWKGDALKTLDALEAALEETNARETACALSAVLRRIAMARHSRDACAGLAGGPWLRWLAANDPRGFDWPAKGAVLIEAPYAPPEKSVAAEALKPLIAAAKEWVR